MFVNVKISKETLKKLWLLEDEELAKCFKDAITNSKSFSGLIDRLLNYPAKYQNPNIRYGFKNFNHLYELKEYKKGYRFFFFIFNKIHFVLYECKIKKSNKLKNSSLKRIDNEREKYEKEFRKLIS